MAHYARGENSVHSLWLLSVPEKGGSSVSAQSLVSVCASGRSSVHSLWLLSIRISVDVLKPFYFQTHKPPCPEATQMV